MPDIVRNIVSGVRNQLNNRIDIPRQAFSELFRKNGYFQHKFLLDIDVRLSGIIQELFDDHT